MIPQQIVEYLERNAVAYERHPHRRACSAQELAASMHVPGRRVAKSVIVKGGDQIWIAVLPATEVVDEKRLAEVLGVPSVRLLHEADFESLFAGCEPGAEPPLRSEEHTSELQSQSNLVCRLLLEKKKNNKIVVGTCRLSPNDNMRSLEASLPPYRSNLRLEARN